MAWRIGIDEAGLGPNLGPLVVSAVVWEIPDDCGEADLWDVFPDLLTDDPGDPLGRLAIADSKALFQPHQGLHTLERSLLALFGTSGSLLCDLAGLHSCLGVTSSTRKREPWFRTAEHPLPRDADGDEIKVLSERWMTESQRVGWRFHAAVSAVVPPVTFNKRLDATGNKAAVLTAVHAEVLRAAWDRTDDGPVTVFSDKHGGRNRYAGVLSEIFAGEWIDVLMETALCSSYRVGRTRLHFEPRAEQHGVVALASMISKYVRELHMGAFNDFWRREQPDLKPTQGYPGDAARFYAAIEPRLKVHGLTKREVWRMK